MNTVEIDGITHDVSLFSPEGQGTFSVLLENNRRLKEAELSVTLLKASAITLVNKLKSQITFDESTIAADK